MTIWSSIPASASTHRPAAFHSRRTATCSPRSRPSIFITSPAAVLRLNGGELHDLLAGKNEQLLGKPGRPICQRFQILQLRNRRASAGRNNSATIKVMAVRMLLKSWATPPASWPMTSIFWAWRS